jgi:penicillin-binding protein 2
MNLVSIRRELGEFKKRYKWMALVVVLVMMVVAGRVVQLQIVEHAHYAGIAEENITRTVSLPATRGVVMDTNGRIVATNRAAHDLYVTPQYLARGDLRRIGELLGLDAAERRELERRVADVPARRRSHQIRVFDDISREQLAAIATHEQDLCLRTGNRENPTRLPCTAIVAEPVRTYPFGALGAHVLGYLNEIGGVGGNCTDAQRQANRAECAERDRRAARLELERMQAQGYRLGDHVGRTGIERAWESFLRGRRGYRRVYVDVRGREVQSASTEEQAPVRREAMPGRDLTLTIDMELMRIVDRAFSGHPSGAVVVVDVRTGALRAVYSKPSYDLALFTAGVGRDEYATLRDDPFRPLIDKSIYESFFPGSTFKPIAALAALEDGLVDPTEHFEVPCDGRYELGNQTFGCTAAHSETALREALVQSCNVYFYQLAQRVGIDRLSRLASDFGLGRRTGIGINTESPGFFPTRAWYERAGGRFRLGDTINTSIGQGDVRLTVVQLAMAYAALANGGTLYVPQLIQRISGPDGTVVEEFEPRVRRRVHVAPEHLAVVIDAMYGVVNHPSGTAFDARIEGGIPVAGKTGTAQVTSRIRSEAEAQRLARNQRPHAWFAGFAPAENPELAIVVVVEHGGGGGRYAAPIGINILQEYLGGRGATVEVAAPRETFAHHGH